MKTPEEACAYVRQKLGYETISAAGGAQGWSVQAKKPDGTRVKVKFAHEEAGAAGLSKEFGVLLTRQEDWRAEPTADTIQNVFEKRDEFYVLQWFDGETLGQRLERGPLAVDEAEAIARTLARALDTLHRHGVYHCDIKPDNVVLSGGGPGGGELRAHLIDFGKARFPSATGPAGQYGSDARAQVWLAPEWVATNPPAPDDKAALERRDLFALAATLHAAVRPGWAEQQRDLAPDERDHRPDPELAATGLGRFVERLTRARSAGGPGCSARDALSVLDGVGAGSKAAGQGAAAGGATTDADTPERVAPGSPWGWVAVPLAILAGLALLVVAVAVAVAALAGGEAPEVDLAMASGIDFGEVAPGERAGRDLVVENRGDAPVRVKIAAPEPFRAPVEAELEPGRSTLRIEVEPTDYAPHEGTLAVDAPNWSGAVRLEVRPDRDADDDGAEARAAGGADCDDRDPARRPGVRDRCGDDLDADCDGADCKTIAEPEPPPREEAPKPTASKGSGRREGTSGASAGTTSWREPAASKAAAAASAPSTPTGSDLAALARTDPAGFASASGKRRGAPEPVAVTDDASLSSLRRTCGSTVPSGVDRDTCAWVAACQWEAGQASLDCACQRCIGRYGVDEPTLAGCAKRAARADISQSCP